MNDDLESRIEGLEQQLFALQVSSVFHARAVGVLLALIEYYGEKHNPRTMTQTGETRRIYRTKLREWIEAHLAGIADENPDLATRMREVLKEQLDKID